MKAPTLESTAIRLQKLIDALKSGDYIYNFCVYDPEKEQFNPNRNVASDLRILQNKMTMLLEYLDLVEIYTPESTRYIKKSELSKAEKKSAEIGRKTK